MTDSKSKVLFTDGEGPIVFKDLAADTTEKVAPGLFPILSLYDDYLAETGVEGYQAGDTLALVVPHFLAHGVKDTDITAEANDAKLCKGVEEYIASLKKDGWAIRIISTAYSQLWERVGSHIGVPMQDIACTKLDLTTLHRRFNTPQFQQLVLKTETQLLSLAALSNELATAIDGGLSVVAAFEDEKFKPLTDILNNFYWHELPAMGFKVLEETIVVGGRRKIESAQEFAQRLGVNLKEIAYVGDSITDDAIHAKLAQEGGLPIAINGNMYALRNARVAVASEDMRDIRPILDAWQKGGFEGVRSVVEGSSTTAIRSKEGAPHHENSEAHYAMVDFSNPEKFKKLLAIHKDSRKKVRGAATARLG